MKDEGGRQGGGNCVQHKAHYSCNSIHGAIHVCQCRNLTVRLALTYSSSREILPQVNELEKMIILSSKSYEYSIILCNLAGPVRYALVEGKGQSTSPVH